MRYAPLAALLLACAGSTTTVEPEPTEEAPDHGAVCLPASFSCECTWQCALVRETDGVWVRLDSEGEQQFTLDPAFTVCDAAGACRPGLRMANDACPTGCAPSRAPMAECVRVPGESIHGMPCVPG